MKIQIEITIKNVDQWTALNAASDAADRKVIREFKREVRDAIADNAGVDWDDIEITKMELIK